MPFDGKHLDDVTHLLIDGRMAIEQGWTQYGYQDDEGNVCMLGAIGFRTDNENTYNEVRVTASHILDEECCGKIAWIWNDAPGRTKEEVLAVYDRVITKRLA